jgi:hypothetical protein
VPTFVFIKIFYITKIFGANIFREKGWADEIFEATNGNIRITDTWGIKAAMQVKGDNGEWSEEKVMHKDDI